MTKHLKEDDAIGRLGRTTDECTIYDRWVDLIRRRPAPDMGWRGSAPLWARLTYLVERHGYLVVSLTLITLTVAQAVQGHLSQKSDFWGHSAAVRELATHPLDPHHPLLLVDRPDTFLNPYTLGVAMLSRWFDLSPVTALSVVGIANLIFLLIVLRLFVTLLLGRRSVAFWVLLFALLVWGWLPWSSSGFFNLMSVASVAPYPSTFAYALTLLALSAAFLLLKGGSPAWAVAILIAQTLVLLSHPPTAIVLYQGETWVLDSSEGVCAGQAQFEYPATFVLFSMSVWASYASLTSAENDEAPACCSWSRAWRPCSWRWLGHTSRFLSLQRNSRAGIRIITGFTMA
jgi:hypothetical protein